MHNDDEKLTLNSLSNEFPTTTIQSAIDCFRLERTVNQLRRLCKPSTLSSSSVEDSEPMYTLIISLTTNERNDAFDEQHDDVDAITDDHEDTLICERNLNANNHRLWKVKAAHDALLGTIDASLLKKTLTSREAPHLDTKSLIAKIDDVAKTIGQS